MIKIEKWQENEKKKKYLRSYQYAKRREQQILDEINRLRTDKMFPSIITDGMPHGNTVSDLSDYIVRVDAEIEKLRAERLEKIKQYSNIEKSIGAMEDEREQEVLRLRYLAGLPWEKEACVLGYSWRQVHNIHSSALNNLKIAYNCT